jgi:hypothetical protein
VTYDSRETLEDFAVRKGIDYPLLADPTTETIRRWGLLDPDDSADNILSGAAPNVAYPGYFVLDPARIVRERFVDGRYDDRRTANGVFATLFPDWIARESRAVSAPHVALTLSQSDRDVVPGSRFTLAVELMLPPGVHVYARDARGYRPLELALRPSPWLEVSPARYPPSKTWRLESLAEEIPVHEGRVRIGEEVHLKVTSELNNAVKQAPEGALPITVEGILRYQACDESQCFPPCEVSLSWELAVHALDLERTDPSLRKPAK